MCLSLSTVESLYLDMILVEGSDERVGEEFIGGRDGSAVISSPFNVLFLPSEALVVVAQAQHQPDSVPAGLRHHKI